MRRVFLTLAVLAAGLACATACTSFILNCPGNPIVSARTLDFNYPLENDVQYYPKQVPYVTTPLCKTCKPKTWSFKHSFAYVTVGGQPLVIDSYSDAGLSVGTLWQQDSPGVQRYNASAPGAASAMTIPDFAFYILGQFSTVAALQSFLTTQRPQLTTDIQNPALVQVLMYGVGFPSVPPAPASNPYALPPGGALAMTIHLHVTDATGAGLLIEFKPTGGYSLYATPVITNEPPWPAMVAWVKNFAKTGYQAAVPGLNVSGGVPQTALIPGNYEDDNWSAANSNPNETNMGSKARLFRAALFSGAPLLKGYVPALTPCAPFPTDQAWSPGFAATAPPNLATYTTLKSAESILGTVRSPWAESALNADNGAQATQLEFIRDHANNNYYFKTFQNANWRYMNLTEMAARKLTRTVKLGAAMATTTPFGVDASSKLM